MRQPGLTGKDSGRIAIDAALLHAAERRDLASGFGGDDADDAVFEPLGEAPYAADVAAVEIGGEPSPFPPPLAGRVRVGVSLATLSASSSVLTRESGAAGRTSSSQ